MSVIDVHVRKRGSTWQYDFKLTDQKRKRKGGFSSKAEALNAGRDLLEALRRGGREVTFAQAFETYLRVVPMKDRSRDSYLHHWKLLGVLIGHLYIEEVTTSVLDEVKLRLPCHLGPRSINHYLCTVRAVLRFMWRRERLMYVPYIPTERVPVKNPKWYTQEERDQLLDGIFTFQPRWYLFYYLTCRLGLRAAEVYAISHRQISRCPPRLTIDQALQRGTGTRPAILKARKNNEEYSLDLTQDVTDAVDWHISQGFAGPIYLFSPDGEFPRYIDSYVRPLQMVQRQLGMRILSHHAVGRHSVASQAATGGESIKVIQMQLGHRSELSTHKYAHVGSQGQLRLVEALTPSSPPHARSKSFVGRVTFVSQETDF